MSHPISSQSPASMSSGNVLSSANVTEIDGVQQGSSQPPNSADSVQSKPTKKDAEDLVNKLNDLMKPDESIKFKLFDKLNEYYMQVVDNKTDTVIQEIPSRHLLESYEAMVKFVGVFFDKKI